MDFPFGVPAAGWVVDNEPVVAFEDNEGAGAAVYRDGAWVELSGDALVAVAVDGEPMPLDKVEAWVNSL